MLPRNRPCRHSLLRSRKRLAVVRAPAPEVDVVEIAAATVVTEMAKTRREEIMVTKDLREVMSAEIVRTASSARRPSRRLRTWDWASARARDPSSSATKRSWRQWFLRRRKIIRLLPWKMCPRRKKKPPKRERMVIRPVTEHSTCASSSVAEKEVDVVVASAVAEEAKAAEVNVATSRTRMAPRGELMTVITRKDHLVNKEDLAAVSREPPRSIRMAMLTTRKVARAFRSVSTEASVVKREAEVEEVTAELPEEVAVPLVEAIVKRPMVRLPTKKARRLLLIRMTRMIELRVRASRSRVAAVEVADAVVVVELPLLRVTMKVLLRLMATTSVVEVGAAVVVAIERTAVVVEAISKMVRVSSLVKVVIDLSAAAVVVVIVPSTVPRLKATSNSSRHTRANTIRTRNINKNLRRNRRVPPLSPTLALPRDSRKPSQTRTRPLKFPRRRARTASHI